MGYYPISKELERENLRKASKDQLLGLADGFLTHTPGPVPKVLSLPFYYLNKEGNRAAVQGLETDSDAALTSALAYRITQAEVYKMVALKHIMAWTECLYAKAHEAKLHLTYRGYKLLEATHHLWAGLGINERNIIMGWIEKVYLPAADALLLFPHNWGAWGWCGVIYAQKVMGEEIRPSQVQALKAHIRNAVNPYTGVMDYEAKRTLSGIWYSYFALAPYTQALLDVKELRGEDNLGLLTKAYDTLFGLCLYPETWPWQNPGYLERIFHPCADELERPKPNEWPSSLLEVVATRILPRPQYLEWIKRPLVNGHVFRYSTLKWAWDITA